MTTAFSEGNEMVVPVTHSATTVMSALSYRLATALAKRRASLSIVALMLGTAMSARVAAPGCGWQE